MSRIKNKLISGGRFEFTEVSKDEVDISIFDQIIGTLIYSHGEGRWGFTTLDEIVLMAEELELIIKNLNSLNGNNT